jgi:hypothetical protein
MKFTRLSDDTAELAKTAAALPGPSSLKINARSVEFPDGVCASFTIAGYPREVGAGWLEPLIGYPGHLDVSLHIEPVPPLIAAQRLRRQLARLESASGSGRAPDFGTEAAANDALPEATAVSSASASISPSTPRTPKSWTPRSSTSKRWQPRSCSTHTRRPSVPCRGGQPRSRSVPTR